LDFMPFVLGRAGGVTRSLAHETRLGSSGKAPHHQLLHPNLGADATASRPFHPILSILVTEAISQRMIAHMPVRIAFLAYLANSCGCHPELSLPNQP
jgi:hypothetical protein